MGVATSAFGNNATSIYQARNDGFIEDPASQPDEPHAAADRLHGRRRGPEPADRRADARRRPAVRGLPDGAPVALALALVGTSVAFTALGTVVGLYSTGWDQQNVVGNLVIQPLVFLGGVFYAVDRLGQPWRGLTHADPIFYMVVAARHGVLGDSEVALALSLGVTLGIAVAMTAWAWTAFLRGVGIRT